MKSPTEQLVDELLVMRCQDGDAEAMNALVSRWQRKLWRHARRLTGREDAAWEVLQDAWLGIIRGLRRLDDAARFRPWAYRIVTNKAADWIKKHRRRREKRQELPEAIPAVETDASADAEEMQVALSKLPIPQAVVLSLHYLENFSVAEIAITLKVPEGTVKSRLHNARGELRRLWQRQ